MARMSLLVLVSIAATGENSFPFRCFVGRILTLVVYAAPVVPRDDPPKKDDSFFLSFISVRSKSSTLTSDNPDNDPRGCITLC